MMEVTGIRPVLGGEDGTVGVTPTPHRCWWLSDPPSTQLLPSWSLGICLRKLSFHQCTRGSPCPSVFHIPSPLLVWELSPTDEADFSGAILPKVELHSMRV